MGLGNAPHPLVGMSRLAKSSFGGRDACPTLPHVGKSVVQKRNINDLRDASSDEPSV